MSDGGKGNRHRATVAAILLGVGMGGFFDQIFLHQILQWHHMLSSVHPPFDMEAMELNMLADGLFHAFVWVVSLVGIFVLWSVGRKGVQLPGFAWFGGEASLWLGPLQFCRGPDQPPYSGASPGPV